jgi:hypothetical protein
MNTTDKHIIDAIAFMTALGGILDYVPVVASLLSIVWLLLQIFTWFRHKKWRLPTGDN